MAALIRIENLSHRYVTRGGEQVEALRGIDLTIEEGEFLAIVGHNGSGKSTLAKHLNALLLPTEGKVWVDGLDTADPQNLWQVRQRVGMVFQNPDNQIVATTVEEDVAFGPENLGIDPAEIRRRVDEALAAVGMAEYALRPPHNLSGGQKQRVAIAGVLAMRPKCIVLDEPTAMLDPVGRAEVLRTVQELNRTERITVVWITHFMSEAAASDRVCVMDRGRISLQGAPKQVFANVEKLKQLHLDVPQVTELAHVLKKAGMPVSHEVLDKEELVEQLVQQLVG
ncbi:MAG: energy-coupling factor transporter ATPase [Firmicutes bacterium]|nr:energy-coupling factor transporter ATPase [Bacillota bacterium]